MEKQIVTKLLAAKDSSGKSYDELADNLVKNFTNSLI